MDGQAAERADVVVIGGGIAGCASAYNLARAGVDVVLLERGELNREASGTNAGNIHVQMIGAAKRITSLEGTERLTTVARLHAAASALWPGLETELGADLGVRLPGGLMVAETEQGLRSLELKSTIERGVGIDSRIVEAADVRKIDPAISDGVIGALWCPVEGFANTLVVAPAFARRAIEAGARLKLQTEVVGIDAQRGGFEVRTTRGRISARRVVVAAGAQTGRLAGMVGLPLEIGWKVLTVAVTEPCPPTMRTVVQHADRLLTVKQTQFGTVVIGGGWPGELSPDGTRKLPLRTSVASNLWIASHVVPALASARLVRAWGGMIAATTERNMIVGEFRPAPGFYVAIADHFGFTAGPLMGRVTADLITRGRTDFDISGFDVMELAGAAAG